MISGVGKQAQSKGTACQMRINEQAAISNKRKMENTDNLVYIRVQGSTIRRTAKAAWRNNPVHSDKTAPGAWIGRVYFP